MGRRNYLIEGVSGTGKTTVCDALLRRGFQAIHGDRELAYQGDPETGQPTETADHEHHLWDERCVRALAADDAEPVTFFCGGSRNFPRFLDVFDEVFVLDVDDETLRDRLERRPAGEWGAKAAERELVLRLHAAGTDVPHCGVIVDATATLDEVVTTILETVRLR